ncbi:MAG: alpha-1,4-glucan--maltose-1-phosphate maltosyltransferase [Propionibacteriaceae bacterium]|nr:alpha-1,4-glucan--maltose-1-phosphate maltosyltransferase [Propionibacteriaceae bacterium]
MPGFGRIPITKVAPVIEGGSYPAKAVVGELVPIQAVVFREGHDGVCASVLLTSPNQVQTRIEMDAIEPVGLDPWLAFFTPDEIGLWTFKIEGWSDPWNTWLHNAHAKLAANIDVELVCLEGRALLEQTASKVDDSAVAKILEQAVTALNPQSTANQLLEVIDQESLQQVMGQHRPRELVSSTPNYPIFVDRKKSLFSAWYEFFPRSIGAVYNSKSESWTSGNFDTCHELLERIAGMGFDVVYLPPIHPIGMSYRKGKNNTLEPATSDPGSPWAIGAEAGGHDAIHPDLGDFAAFARFVKKTNDLGMEVALDLALQCSPDHPWVKTHPQWFTTRLDGTIAYAENPPKKYQDIYPLNFDNDPNGIYHEILNIVRFWMEHGVRIFRVDNPHTKPVRFWAWLIAEIRKTDPDVIFLAEAFTKPEMMHALGKVGFQQSYTYFTWRNAKWELTEYLNELSQESAAFFRPNFFVNTPDINPFFLQSGNPAAFAIRAILAATMSPSWGVYSGFEYFEHEPLRLGGEEYLNSEKYEYRPRDYDQENLCALLGKLNQIRTAHPALQQLRNITFHHVPHDQVIAFSKRVHDDTVFVICSLDATGTPESEVHVDYAALGFAQGQQLKLFDELTQVEFNWGEHNFVRLPPAAPAHILTVIR